MFVAERRPRQLIQLPTGASQPEHVEQETDAKLAEEHDVGQQPPDLWAGRQRQRGEL